MAVPDDVIEQWKEINASARHWESLIFQSATGYFTVVVAALAGAGATISWTGMDESVQRWAVACFLIAAIGLAALALIALGSQERYVRRFYARRRALENENIGLRLRDNEEKTGDEPKEAKSGTMSALRNGFVVAIALAAVLLALLPIAR